MCVTTPNEETQIKATANSYRAKCLALEDKVRGLMHHNVFFGEPKFLGQHAEMHAQIMLAVRHLEDARMRLGKVCQYADDGVSVFDKEKKED